MPDTPDCDLLGVDWRTSMPDIVVHRDEKRVKTLPPNPLMRTTISSPIARTCAIRLEIVAFVME